MRKKKTIKRRSPVRRERDPIPWRYCILSLACGLILVGGFFLAGRLHFSSINYGFKNSKLRQEVEKLQTEHRHLILQRERSLSGINKVAKKIGFRKRTLDNIEIVSRRKPADNAKLVSSAPGEKPVKAFTNSKTLVRQKPVKLKDIEKKISKTVVSEPARAKRKVGNRKERKEETRAKLAPSTGLIAKKR